MAFGNMTKAFLSPIPFGFLIGAFTGALMGELLLILKHKRLKAAAGSLLKHLVYAVFSLLF
jgi:uncharacterized protein YqgC (DUF456 family)